ncbi:WD40 repeat-like protein [Patellaria atrata CBS 101060]|uniref:WD40 repeat-like protein n=1 Tax=Patellaria atrata CBS 101060 TaxID=1346257 RepID=A0A9P4SJD1_9PEZI|nr:WD40 repeat-like protein [Patellaria atrata CBS 101060]
MPKRKRGPIENGAGTQNGISKQHKSSNPRNETVNASEAHTQDTYIQVITGSYERVLHGFTVAIPPKRLSNPSEASPEVKVADTFLFNAHTSAIRCVAVSPSLKSPESKNKLVLASGSTDERINLYQLSTSPPSRGSKPSLPSLTGATVSENRKNRELGSLLHHASSVTALYWPQRGKLMSAAEDNTIAVTRSRDWTVLSTIKAPMPAAVGRPSGDTAAAGDTPAGVNDFAVHPSMKLMVSVGKGEKCVRLWNLMTGKKAGVLNFEKDMLQKVGEGKWGSGEGRKVVWDKEGTEFAIAFERGVAIYDLNSKPKLRIVPQPRTKIHEISYLPDLEKKVLVLSTEDGRILFYSTEANSSNDLKSSETQPAWKSLPECILLGQIGGKTDNITGRIKDFQILPLSSEDESSVDQALVVAGSSDGAVRTWCLNLEELVSSETANGTINGVNGDSAEKEKSKNEEVKSMGTLIKTYETGNRITCLTAFIMTGSADSEEDDDGASQQEEKEGSDSDSDSS